MRILFSTTPALGHLLPLLPLARAARGHGHDVAVLTAQQNRERPARVAKQTFVWLTR
jgi:UDP:flavonoid glycosyltransferase YjiC (YdhE family)